MVNFDPINAGIYFADDEISIRRVAEHQIIKWASTPEKAIELTQYLASIDWFGVYEERKQKNESLTQQALARGGGFCDACKNFSQDTLIEDVIIGAGKLTTGKFCYPCIKAYQETYVDAYSEWYRPCDNCHKHQKSKYLISEHPVIRVRHWGYCVDCINIIEESKRIKCNICGIMTIEHTAKDVCNDCYKKHPNYKIVSSHNNRAIALQLPATLTLKQWEQAVEYFNHKCAYCGKPYEVLEHYLSLSFGGGTTVDNCVPSCKSCNGVKGNKRVGEFEKLFPVENIQRIKKYFLSSAAIADGKMKQVEK